MLRMQLPYPRAMSQACILLLEDDPVSAAFIRDALPSPPELIHASTLAQAHALVKARSFTLMLVDCQLPDGHGADLLVEVRSQPGLNRDTPAIALSAEICSELSARLFAAGFSDCLTKPLPAAQLQGVVRLWSERREDALPCWDDASAQRALGTQPETLRKLRGMLCTELPLQRSRVQAAFAAGNFVGMNAELHRLRAACGFCGAEALAEASAALREQPSSDRLRAWLRACHQLPAPP